MQMCIRIHVDVLCKHVGHMYHVEPKQNFPLYFFGSGWHGPDVVDCGEKPFFAGYSRESSSNLNHELTLNLFCQEYLEICREFTECTSCYDVNSGWCPSICPVWLL